MNDTKETRSALVSELETARKENSQLKSLVENSRDVLFRMSLPDGRYEYISPASITIFGFTPEEIYNSPCLLKI